MLAHARWAHDCAPCCLELFKDGPGLDGEDKRDLALALSVNTALEALDAQLRAAFSTTQLYTMVSLTLIGYMALSAAPEPVSKSVAGALALLMWGYLGWELFDELQRLAQLISTKGTRLNRLVVEGTPR